MAWFKKTTDQSDKRVRIPEGLWVKCNNCKEIIYRMEVERNLQVCPKCNYHFRISSRKRLELLTDKGTFQEIDPDLASSDPLKFKDIKPYRDRLRENQKRSGLTEAIITGEAKLNGIPVVIAVMDFSFMGGSMGSVVGEKATRAVEFSIEKRLPLIISSASGGARMQEGMFSLIQMAKVSSAIGRLKETSTPYISILTDPTFGGVSASFAMLGDIIMAEPRSLIGFAGPKVIEQTIKQQLPSDFQKAEFLLEHGLIDMVVNRRDLKETIFKILTLLAPSQSSNL
jgi:acetyl-CoA carboxylase carboxyl transferase subunit beta